MKCFFIPLVLSLLVAPASHAEVTIKCVVGSSVSFQDTPCAGESAQAQSLPPDPSVVSSSRGKLQIGVSDLMVLNNRRWGTPQRITRKREARVWHEYWNYDSGADGRHQLHFINVRLADAGVIPPPVITLGITPAEMILEHDNSR